MKFSTITDLLNTHPSLGKAVKPIDVSRCGHLAIGWIDGDQSGAAILSADNRVDADTIYEIGSITKGLTGIALARAVLNGEVTLDDTLYELLPFEDKEPFSALQSVTLEGLATHSSGLPRLPNLGIWYAFSSRNNPYAQVDKQRLGAALAKTKLWKPGSSNYSNLGYGLLGWILSHRLQMGYGSWIQQQVLEPLGMSRTLCLYPSTKVLGFAPALKKNCNGGHPWTFTDPTAGAGGLGSNLQDMTTLLRALLSPEKTPLADAIHLATEPRQPFIEDQRIGLGWLTQSEGDESILWHNGGTGCFASFIGVNRKTEKGVVLLLNRPLPDGVTEAGLSYLTA